MILTRREPGSVPEMMLLQIILQSSQPAAANSLKLGSAGHSSSKSKILNLFVLSSSNPLHRAQSFVIHLGGVSREVAIETVNSSEIRPLPCTQNEDKNSEANKEIDKHVISILQPSAGLRSGIGPADS